MRRRGMEGPLGSFGERGGPSTLFASHAQARTLRVRRPDGEACERMRRTSAYQKEFPSEPVAGAAFAMKNATMARITSK
jgi:hypothetical protein